MRFWPRWLRSARPPLDPPSAVAEVERLAAAGALDEAVSLARASLSGRDEGTHRAARHVLTLRLAGVLRARGDIREAHRVASGARAEAEREHGPNCRAVLARLLSLSETCIALGDAEGAFAASQRAMLVAEATLARESVDFASVLIQTARITRFLGEPDAARALLESACATLRALPDDGGYLSAALANLDQLDRSER